MLNFDEAFAMLADVARPIGVETVSIHAAHGRRLARPVVAAVDSPRSDVSSMDGYAVREEDLALGYWRRIGAAYPGQPFDGQVGPGECVRIFTGGPVPVGADRVLVQEIVTAQGDEVRLTGAYGDHRWVRPRASDFAIGDVLLPAGRMLDRRALVALGGADAAEAEVFARPGVAILASGDELVAPGAARATAASIPESVSIGVAALVADHGGHVVHADRVPDDRAAMALAAERALAAADVVVMAGGASVGEKDFAKAAFDDLGLDLLFSRIAIKPGKPIWFGRARGKFVIGLPGNPTSAMVTGRLFLAPLLVGLGGGDAGGALTWREAALAAPLGGNGDREAFTRARTTPDGLVAAGNQDSGAQATLAFSDVLIRQPIGSPARAAGEMVTVIDY